MSYENETKATIYSKPGCVQCNAMERHLKTKGVPYRKIDITEDEAAYKWVQDMGYQGVPVTVIGFRHAQGFDPDWANAAIAARAGV